MTVPALLCILAGVLHLGFFVLETILWNRPAVHRMFGARSADAAAAIRPIIFNLGFYNLFLGVGAMVGGVMVWADGSITLAVYTCAFMVGAAAVLLATSRAMWRGALAQGLIPAIALVLLAV